MTDLAELMDKLIDQEGLYRSEGRQGIINTCKIVRAIGYKDPCYTGQLAAGACTGDLIMFLEDNPGAIEAIHDWIRKQNAPEWINELKAIVPEDDEEDHE